MPIDLVCSSCSRMIRAPDEAAGKQVRCPHCQAVNDAPQTAEVVGGNPFAAGAAASNNPFAAPPPQPMHDLGDDAAVRMLLPVGRSGWAIAAGYAGLFAVVCFPAPLAILLGVIAIVHLRRNPKLHGWGRAIFGLVMGIICTVPLIGVLIAMATGH
jgi:LSD1 subclass zinc finger protein